MKELMLGSAMWGWTVSMDEAFSILDRFYELGGKFVDCATNYPINKNPEDFRRAESILAEWTRLRKVEDLKITMKVGSLDNMMSPNNNLSLSFLLMQMDHYLGLFGDNLHTLSIHWDNREDQEEVSQTLELNKALQEHDVKMGFSGLKYPEHYQSFFDESAEGVQLQAKHNVFYSDVDRYDKVLKNASYAVYGMNAGGVKLEGVLKGSAAERRGVRLSQNQNLILAKLKSFASDHDLKSMNEIGMLNALGHPKVEWLILGAASKTQVEQAFLLRDKFESDQGAILYQELLEILN